MKKSDIVQDNSEHIDSLHNDTQEFVYYEKLSRREIRSIIFHLLYAMETFEYQTSLVEIVDNFNRGFSLDIPLTSEAVVVAQAVVDSRDTLDEIIKPLLINWRFDRIGLCTKLILRLAIWEIVNTQEPHNIIINEAIELAKCFSETDAYKFINGILDEAVKTIRPDALIEDEITPLKNS
jgi:transcription antitermination protein NusB